MTENELSTLGEFGLIRRIQQQAGTARHLIKGIGDDCAVQIQQPEQELLTSTDLLIEGVHFNRRWISMEQLGRKAAAVNISDIAAMGGTPQSLFFAVGCPQKLSVVEIEDLSRGFLAEAEHYGAVLAGGDTCRSPGPLFLSVTVQGVIAAGSAIFRQGARAGDAIYVSGALGDSALALRLLQQGKSPPADLLARHLTPQARVTLGQLLSRQQLASALIDISDGLLADLGHILEDSAVGADLELECLPLSDAFRNLLAADRIVIDLALAGGEDYELLFTSAHQNLAGCADFSPPVTRIGSIRPGSGISIYQANRSLYHCSRGGFDHFT